VQSGWALDTKFNIPKVGTWCAAASARCVGCMIQLVAILYPRGSGVWHVAACRPMHCVYSFDCMSCMHCSCHLLHFTMHIRPAD
jgi:hypothetical protein